MGYTSTYVLDGFIRGTVYRFSGYDTETLMLIKAVY